MPVGTDSIYKSQNGVLYSSSTQYLSNLFLNAVFLVISVGVSYRGYFIRVYYIYIFIIFSVSSYLSPCRTVMSFEPFSLGKI